MLSEMAHEDIKYLTGLGVRLEPDQIVRLNDLSLKVVNGRRSADFIHAPRVAWINREHVLHEPTIAMGMWLRDCASQWWSGDKLLNATAWASANCHIRGFFDSRTDPKSVSKEVDAWRRELNCTAGQMLAALMYCIEGDESKPETVSVASAMAEGCPYTDIIADAVAACLGATIEELESKPIRILEEYVRRWARNQAAQAGVRADLSIRGRNKDLEAYQAYVEELEKGAVKNG
jgi:hypothetical protein